MRNANLKLTPMDQRGLTLLEFLITLGLLALLLLLAYRETLPTRQEEALVAEIRSLLQRARTEAIRRGNWVAVQVQGEELISCLDAQGNGHCDAHDPILQQVQPRPYGAQLRLFSGTQPGLRYNALGQLNTGGRVEVRIGQRTRTLCLSLAGRVRETMGAGC